MTVSTIVISSLIEFGVGFASAMVAAVAWRYRSKRVGRPIFVMAVATGLYAASNGLNSFVADPLWWHLLNNVTYPIGAVLAVSSLYVVIEFIDRESMQRPAIVALCAGFILVDFAVAMTDPFHNLFISSQQVVDGVVVGTAGPLFFVHTFVSLSIVAVAVGLLIVELPTTSGVYRQQTVAVIAAFGVGMAGFAWQSFAPLHPALDVATVGMLGWSGLILWGVFTADFLDIVPIGRDRMVRSIEDPMITHDSANRVVDSNPAARRLSDIESGSDWEGIPVSTFFESYPTLVSAINNADTRDLALDVDGETRHVTLSVSPIYRNEADDTSPLGCTVVIRDVTELVDRQRELEATNEQLESARNRYRSLFENTPLVIWEEDLSETVERAREIAAETDDLVEYLESNPAEHRQLFETIEVIDVNENAVEAYAADSKDELLDRFDDLLTEEWLATNRRLIQRLVDGGRRFREETTYRRLDGGLRDELVDVIVPEAHADDCSRVLIAGTDITEQKEREQELQYQSALFEAINESTDTGILVVSPDREILWYNTQFQEMWELPTDVLADTDDNERAINHVLDMVADTEAFVESTEGIYEPPYQEVHAEIELLDGRWFDRYTAPVVGDDGTLYGLLTLTRDITDRKQYETRIETQNQWLERLAQVISHDLRTPLTTADNHLRLLNLELDDPAEPVAESLTDLERTHERLRKFTEHLPQLARESTNIDESTACELSTVAENAWSVVETDPLELVVDSDGTLRADPRRLQQLFENCFANVVEHATNGDSDDAAHDNASTVWVGVHDNGFYIEDDGPGITPEQGEEIFEYGMSTANSSGIGLAIVRNITEAHGWSISVANRDGGGARFTVETDTEHAPDSTQY